MKIQLYQVVYDEDSAAGVSPYAAPLPVDNKRQELYEYQAFLSLLRKRSHLECDYIGVFSCRFTQKTGLSLLEVREVIHDHPGHDVYTFNPYPYLCYRFFNQWECGEHFHPGLKIRAQVLADAYGLRSIEDAPRLFPTDAAYCNYWVGSRHFFEDYARLLEDCIHFAYGNAELLLASTLHNEEPAPFLPFILERLFSHYILDATSFRRHSFLYPDNVVEFQLGELPLRQLECLRLLVMLVRPEIDRLDAWSQKSSLSRSQYTRHFQDINRSAEQLIETSDRTVGLKQLRSQLAQMCWPGDDCSAIRQRHATPPEA